MATNPHVLTPSEMEVYAHGDDGWGWPVFVEECPENSHSRCFWALAQEDPIKPSGVRFNAIDGHGCAWDGDWYGKWDSLGWRAWSDRPTEAQKRREPW